VAAALGAGYDIALLSKAELIEYEAAAKAARPLSPEAIKRLARAEDKRGNHRVDVAALHSEVEKIFRENGLL
jgi:beta-N-acetylhexosaminidase